MAQALREFVEKDEKDAISTLVKWQLDQAQEHLKTRQNIHEDNIEGEVLKHTEQIRQKEEENEDNDAEDIRKVSPIHSANLKNVNTGQKFLGLLLCYIGRPIRCVMFMSLSLLSIACQRREVLLL